MSQNDNFAYRVQERKKLKVGSHCSRISGVGLLVNGETTSCAVCRPFLGGNILLCVAAIVGLTQSRKWQAVGFNGSFSQKGSCSLVYLIRILLWLKWKYLYPKTIQKCILNQNTFKLQLLLGSLQTHSTFTLSLPWGPLWKQSAYILRLLLRAPFKSGEYST